MFCDSCWILPFYLNATSGVRRKNLGGEFKGLAGIVGGPGAEPPDTGELSKIWKKFHKIIEKWVFSPILQKEFKTLR